MQFFLRNRMLNKFLDEKAAKGVVMNNTDEVVKVKRYLHLASTYIVSIPSFSMASYNLTLQCSISTFH